MINSNQYLTFNPKQRPFRTDKQQRQNLQLRFKTAPPNHDLPYQNFHPHPKHHEPKKTDYSKDASYELTESHYSTRQKEEDRKKEDILERVKQLQSMVLPLVEREGEEEEQNEIGWQSRIERKMLRLESSLDSVRKEWQIEMEKKLMQLEEQLEEKYSRLKAKVR